MDIQHALKDPADAFASPEAVLENDQLSAEQKKMILEQWLQDAKQLEGAAAENMAGGEPNMLHRVLEALSRLDD
jgi:hypothetical protein